MWDGDIVCNGSDGTLLNRHAALSNIFTTDALNQLPTDGVSFSYATARSWFSAWRITHGLVKSFPVVVITALLFGIARRRKSFPRNISAAKKCAEAREDFPYAGVFPFVYSLFGKVEPGILSCR